MGGIFKSIKDLFVETDETSITKTQSVDAEVDGAAVKEVEKELNQPSQTSQPSPITLSSGDKDGEVNEKFLDLLFGVLEENNLKGFDYLEYKKSLQAMKKMGIDEETRFKSAFATGSTVGATKQKLIDTTQVYIDLLAKEEQKFMMAWKRQAETQIGGKQDRKAELETALSDKKALIEKLTAEISEHEVELDQMDTELADITAKVSKTKNDFLSSYDYLINQLRGDVEKMKLYLK